MWHAVISRRGAAERYCNPSSRSTALDVGAICSLCASIVHSYRAAICNCFCRDPADGGSGADVLQTRIYREYTRCTQRERERERERGRERERERERCAWRGDSACGKIGPTRSLVAVVGGLLAREIRESFPSAGSVRHPPPPPPPPPRGGS